MLLVPRGNDNRYFAVTVTWVKDGPEDLLCQIDVSNAGPFEGGFLGLDNIGLFDRPRPLSAPSGLEQSDGTAWIAMYYMSLLESALRLADEITHRLVLLLLPGPDGRRPVHGDYPLLQRGSPVARSHFGSTSTSTQTLALGSGPLT
jgi:hypothetical protein